MSKQLTTVHEVVDVLGGRIALAKMFNCDPRRISNWITANEFPAKTYVVLNDALRAKSKSASKTLWAMVDLEKCG